MERNELRNKLKNLFEETGLEIFPGEEDSVLEIDSLRVISLIVAIEDEFSVEVPDEYINYSTLISFNDFWEMVNALVLA